jgi:hypothetical protein
MAVATTPSQQSRPTSSPDATRRRPPGWGTAGVAVASFVGGLAMAATLLPQPQPSTAGAELAPVAPPAVAVDGVVGVSSAATSRPAAADSADRWWQTCMERAGIEHRSADAAERAVQMCW